MSGVVSRTKTGRRAESGTPSCAQKTCLLRIAMAFGASENRLFCSFLSQFVQPIVNFCMQNRAVSSSLSECPVSKKTMKTFLFVVKGGFLLSFFNMPRTLFTCCLKPVKYRSSLEPSERVTDVFIVLLQRLRWDWTCRSMDNHLLLFLLRLPGRCRRICLWAINLPFYY